MRISDWSSDVCSSDLCCRYLFQTRISWVLLPDIMPGTVQAYVKSEPLHLPCVVNSALPFARIAIYRQLNGGFMSYVSLLRKRLFMLQSRSDSREPLLSTQKRRSEERREGKEWVSK